MDAGVASATFKNSVSEFVDDLSHSLNHCKFQSGMHLLRPLRNSEFRRISLSSNTNSRVQMILLHSQLGSLSLCMFYLFIYPRYRISFIKLGKHTNIYLISSQETSMKRKKVLDIVISKISSFCNHREVSRILWNPLQNSSIIGIKTS